MTTCCNKPLAPVSSGTKITTLRQDLRKFLHTPTVTNEKGAKQSGTVCRFDLIPSTALFCIAHVLHYGAERYGEWNWINLTVEDNVNHAIQHLYAWLAGDKTEAHLSHAAVRLMFALALQFDIDNNLDAEEF